mgnify:CR=1 FL=1
MNCEETQNLIHAYIDAELDLVRRGDEVVERTVDSSQAERQPRALDLVRAVAQELASRGVGLSDLDLLQDEPQVRGVEVEPRSDRRCLRRCGA